MFKNGNSIKKHLEDLKNYSEFLKIKDHFGKVMLLKESLPETIWYEVIFDKEFNIKNKYKWFTDRIENLFPEKENEFTKQVDVYRIKQNNSRFAEFLSDIKVNCVKRSEGFSSHEI